MPRGVPGLRRGRTKRPTEGGVLAFPCCSLSGDGEPMKMSNVGFKNTSVAAVFAFLVRAADLKYTVIDDKTIVVTAAQ